MAIKKVLLFVSLILLLSGCLGSKETKIQEAVNYGDLEICFAEYKFVGNQVTLMGSIKNNGVRKTPMYWISIKEVETKLGLFYEDENSLTVQGPIQPRVDLFPAKFDTAPTPADGNTRA